MASRPLPARSTTTHPHTGSVNGTGAGTGVGSAGRGGTGGSMSSAAMMSKPHTGTMGPPGHASGGRVGSTTVSSAKPGGASASSTLSTLARSSATRGEKRPVPDPPAEEDDSGASLANGDDSSETGTVTVDHDSASSVKRTRADLSASSSSSLSHTSSSSSSTSSTSSSSTHASTPSSTSSSLSDSLDSALSTLVPSSSSTSTTTSSSSLSAPHPPPPPPLFSLKSSPLPTPLIGSAPKHPHAIQVVKVPSDGGPITLTPEGAWFFQNRVGNRLLSIYTMAGPARTGKSSNLNYLCPTSRFGVGSSVEACTKGIFVSQQIHELDNPHHTVMVTMDTEGIGHVSAESKTDNAIMTLAILCSSILSFNNKEKITRETTESLALAAKLADELRVSEERKMADMSPEEIHETMPHLNFTVVAMVLSRGGRSIQDYIEDTVIPPGTRTGDIIRRMMVERSANEITAACKNREDEHRIATEFARVTRVEYRQDLERWKRSILSIATRRPKMIRKQMVTGTTFWHLLTSYVAALNSDKMPVIHDVWTMLRSVRSSNVLTAAVGELRRRLDEQKLGSHLISDSDLESRFSSVVESMSLWFPRDPDATPEDQKSFGDQWHRQCTLEFERVVSTLRQHLEAFFTREVLPECDKLVRLSSTEPKALNELLLRYRERLDSLISVVPSMSTLGSASVTLSSIRGGPTTTSATLGSGTMMGGASGTRAMGTTAGVGTGTAGGMVLPPLPHVFRTFPDISSRRTWADATWCRHMMKPQLEWYSTLYARVVEASQIRQKEWDEIKSAWEAQEQESKKRRMEEQEQFTRTAKQSADQLAEAQREASSCKELLEKRASEYALSRAEDKKLLEERDAQMAQLTQSHKELVSKTEQEKRTLSREIAEQRGESRRMTELIDQTTRQRDELLGRVSKMQQEMQSVESELQETSERLQHVSDEKVRTVHQLTKVNTELSELTRRMTDLKTESSRLRTELESNKAERLKWEDQCTKLSEQLKASQDQYQQTKIRLEGQVEKLTAELDVTRKNRDALQTKLTSTMQDRSSLERTVEDQRRELDACQVDYQRRMDAVHTQLKNQMQLQYDYNSMKLDLDRANQQLEVKSSEIKKLQARLQGTLRSTFYEEGAGSEPSGSGGAASGGGSGSGGGGPLAGARLGGAWDRSHAAWREEDSERIRMARVSGGSGGSGSGGGGGAAAAVTAAGGVGGTVGVRGASGAGESGGLLGTSETTDTGSHELFSMTTSSSSPVPSAAAGSLGVSHKPSPSRPIRPTPTTPSSSSKRL